VKPRTWCRSIIRTTDQLRPSKNFSKVLRHILDTGRMPSGPGRIGLPLESAAGHSRLWVAGNGPRTLRLTGQYADGWIASRSMTMGPGDYGQRKRVVAAHAGAAGRPEPKAGLGAFILLGESRARIREMFEVEPLGKLLALVLKAEHFQRHGLEHPVGAEHRGIVDLVPHALDPGWLEELAPRIPFEVLEEVLVMGNVEEIVKELKPYADQGCEHVMLINNTGLVGGISEMMAQAP
jgi:phthiodiolone/phenolphthiodiolone dimycocerosates ketoreductase